MTETGRAADEDGNGARDSEAERVAHARRPHGEVLADDGERARVPGDEGRLGRGVHEAAGGESAAAIGRVVQETDERPCEARRLPAGVHRRDRLRRRRPQPDRVEARIERGAGGVERCEVDIAATGFDRGSQRSHGPVERDRRVRESASPLSSRIERHGPGCRAGLTDGEEDLAGLLGDAQEEQELRGGRRRATAPSAVSDQGIERCGDGVRHGIAVARRAASEGRRHRAGQRAIRGGNGSITSSVTS